jgi:hypothetical protein
MSSQAFGDSFAVRPKAKIAHESTNYNHLLHVTGSPRRISRSPKRLLTAVLFVVIN